MAERSKNNPKTNTEENTLIKPYEDADSAPHPLRGPEAFPLLEIVQGPRLGAWFTVAYQKEITLGRAATNSIILEDNSVSRTHSVLQSDGRSYTLRDIGSRNGTFVNEKKIQGEVELRHLDAIKIGIYTLRFLTEPTEEPFEFLDEHTPHAHVETQELPSEVPVAPVAQVSEPLTPAEAGGAQNPPAVPEEELPLESGQSAELMPVEAPEESALPPKIKATGNGGAPLKNLVILLGVGLFLAGGGYLAYRLGVLDRLANKGEKTSKVSSQEKKPAEEKITSSQPSQIKTETAPAQAPAANTGEQIPIFLEVSSAPIAAKVFYQGKELGVTPFKISLQIPPGKPQEISAEFFLEGVQEKVTTKQTFQANQQDAVVAVDLKPALGTLKIEALPKRGELYLEGGFGGAPGASKSVKLDKISFNQPIYLPLGKYVAEIRVAENLEGGSSQVNVVRYRREFEFKEGQNQYTLSASEGALANFPAKISTQPSGAELLVDGKKMGDTPFSGDLPMGRHKLTLKKEGFSDFEKEISIEMNTPYEASFNLETSPAGEYVNKGRDLLKKGMASQAIENLAEALKRNPEITERHQIHMLLGEAFVQTKTFDQALAYYQKAAESPDYAPAARVGMAEAYAGLGQKDQAYLELLQVFLNTQDNKTRSQVETVFKRISPMRSLLYVATEPAGAQIQINGQSVSQPTPVILSDLMVGSYRISIQKPGFKNFETRVSLPISSIKPVVVQLQAE